MATERPKALMACSNFWNSPFQVGSHHIARGLVESGWDVAFIGDPICPIDFISPSARREVGVRWSIYRSGGEWHLDNHLWSYVPAALVAPHNRFFFRSKWVHRSWQNWALPNPLKPLKAAGFDRVDLLYIDSFTQSFWMDTIPYRRCVYRMADFNRFQKRYCAAAEAMERKLAQRSDRVLVPSRRLEQVARDLGAQSVAYFPNGGACSHFSEMKPSRPREYQNLTSPIAVYMGVMPEWFDFDLVGSAARRLPDVSFVLIGPDRLTRARLADVENVHILGVRPYAEVPAYLHHAQVGLMPFDVRRYPEVVHGLHPQKLYAYSACGIPTVAMAWEELIALNSPAILCGDQEEFAKAIETAITQPTDRDLLQRFSRESDWSNRLPLFLNIIHTT